MGSIQLRFCVPILALVVITMVITTVSGCGTRVEQSDADGTAAEDEFVSIFNGTDLTGWIGAMDGHAVQNGTIVVLEGSGGNLYYEEPQSDFILQFEFKLEAGSNNGVGIRAEYGKNAAYYGMEIQVIDNTTDRFGELADYQYHGSIYGVVPARRGALRPVGEWNEEEILADGNHIRVTLNGTVIVDADILEASADGTIDHTEHPGLFNPEGLIGFLGHGDRVEFRNIRLKKL